VKLVGRTVSVGKVTSLDHEVLDDTVEGGSLVAKALLASCQSAEVLSRFWDGLAIETDDYATHLFPAMFDVEVDLAK
jgi:hypothetical protein